MESGPESARSTASENRLVIKKQAETDTIAAIAGNPNVGKSTVFNALTGMRQHTGNWPGKTVAIAQGHCRIDGNGFVLVDIPGTYSLSPHSAEEEVARDFICLSSHDAVVVVCDACCLERNLILALQAMETGCKMLLCVNMMDEARRKGIEIDLGLLSERLGVPVVGISARKRKTLSALKEALSGLCEAPAGKMYKIRYTGPLERAVESLQSVVERAAGDRFDCRWLSLRLLEDDETLLCGLERSLGFDITRLGEIRAAVGRAKEQLCEDGFDQKKICDNIASCAVLCAEEICTDAVRYDRLAYHASDRKIDSVLTGKWLAYPAMLALLALVFWITIFGANYPSGLLSGLFRWLGRLLRDGMDALDAPLWLTGALIDGVYGVLSQVVSVMLPPMAIFFPLFTMLEDSGYLPRVAYNLDRPFAKCSACGKQALTMCMGFGCNAAGVVGCRIIDSPRERLIAVLTNSLVPCNGRFPILISVITIFFIGSDSGFAGSLAAALLLTSLIALSVAVTLLCSRLLSKTVLKGQPSSFVLEMPPYRKPQFLRVIIRSVFDRTLFVLGRAVCAAAPAGLVIWLLANIYAGDISLLRHCAGFLDPFARLFGLDGIILMAFILGLPANETVIPIAVMAYMSSGMLTELSSDGLRLLFEANGWNAVTAVSVLLFTLFHWPCATTLMTVAKETKSVSWTALAFALPTAVGLTACFIFANTAGLAM